MIKERLEQLSVCGGVMALGIVVLACKGNKTDDTQASASVVAIASAAPTASPLTRYPDEQSVDAVVVKIKEPTTARLSADTSSKDVGTLKANDSVVPVALHGEFALIAIGSDLSAAPTGWIPGSVLIDALKPKPSTTKPAPICKTGYKASFFEGVTSCIKQCKTDSDCGNPPCSSNGLCMSDDEEPTLAAANKKPSGGTNTRSAPGATIDQVTIKTSAEGDPLEACPTGWVGMPGGQCNRPCKADGDCHGSNKCQKLGSDRFCDDHTWE